MNKFLTRLIVVFLVAVGAFAQTAPVSRSTVGSRDLGDTFGYQIGQMQYRPWYGKDKSVDMTEQVVTLSYKCSALIAGTQHVATVEVAAAVNPSLLWEKEYHRLVAIYGSLSTKGGDKNVVNQDDIKAGVTTYIGQHQEYMCGLASKKSLKDLLINPSIGFAAGLTELVRRDTRSPFDVKTQTVRVVLPEELLRALALKGLDDPKPVVKTAVKPVAKHVVPTLPQPPATRACCACLPACNPFK